MSLPTIGTLWIGRELSWLEQLCLQSFLDHGHEVFLYSYDEVKNVPPGIQSVDATEILPAEKIIRHARTGSPAYHADIFRLHMLHITNHIWADTDAFCCKPWNVSRDAHFHGWISDPKPLVNNGVLGLPKASATLAAMLKFTSDEYPIPPWFSPRKQNELQELKSRGEGVHVSLLPWGVWGPNALTWFLKEAGEITHSLPGHALYPVPFAKAGHALNKNRTNQVKALIDDNTLSIHFWGRRFRNIAAKYDGVPSEGTYISELLASHNIDPRKTAHLMRTPKPKIEAIKDSAEIDFSMFTNVDVANLVLQNSEVNPVELHNRDWIEGSGSALLKYAQDNRDRILSETLAIASRECGYFMEATDHIVPTKVADIGCGYAFVAYILYQRYQCELVLIDTEEHSGRHFRFSSSGAGYSSLTKAKAFLEQNGVPAERITLINPMNERIARVGKVDLAISLASCGFQYPIMLYQGFFRDQITADGGIVLDIRKGSGGIGAMKSFGNVNVLAKHAEYSTILICKGTAND